MDSRTSKENTKHRGWFLRILILLCFLYFLFSRVFVPEEHAPEIDWPATGLATLIPAPEDPRGEIIENTDQSFEVQLKEVSDEEYFFYASNLEQNFKNELPMQIYAEYVPELARWKTLHEMIDDSYQRFLQGERQQTDWIMLMVYECSFEESVIPNKNEDNKERMREEGYSMLDEHFQGYDTAGNQLSFSRIEDRLTIEVRSCESVALSMEDDIPPVPEDAGDDLSENTP